MFPVYTRRIETAIELTQHEVVSLSSLSRDTEMESPRVSQPRSRSRSHTPQHLGLFKQNAETTSGGDDFKGLILKCDD